jgi:hypothetical protein
VSEQLAFRAPESGPGWTSPRRRFLFIRRRARPDHKYRRPAPDAVPVRAVRGQAPGCLIRHWLRLQLRRLTQAEPIPDWLADVVQMVEAFGDTSTRVQQVLCRIRRRRRYRLAPRQTEFRSRLRPLAGINCMLRFRRQVSTM